MKVKKIISRTFVIASIIALGTITYKVNPFALFFAMGVIAFVIALAWSVSNWNG